MLKKELIERSPLRILEKSIHGGVGKGNIGVIASKKGVGKTACLVHLATDQLFQGKHVIHVSFSNDTKHIISWYEDIFQEISKRRELEHAMEVHNEIIHNRVIMNFNFSTRRIPEVLERIESMISQANFKADCVVVDGYNFPEGNVNELKEIREFANKHGLEFWFSATVPEGDKSLLSEHVTPEILTNYLSEIAIVIMLKPIDGIIHLRLLKDHDQAYDEDLHLKLDPKILLISRE
ncbi:MAG: AAA family ATPase [Spirochaetales bacterium]|nr:AAA family ATPase [Spirochaetales bacterium]